MGNLAEDKATRYLQDRGFEIVQRNFSCRFGEIDIIALKDDVIHFVEVKSGQNPFEQITPSKLSKVIKTSQWYLQQKNFSNPFQIDAIMITDTIEYFENITL